jgi:hypothetical protein
MSGYEARRRTAAKLRRSLLILGDEELAANYTKVAVFEGKIPVWPSGGELWFTFLCLKINLAAIFSGPHRLLPRSA